MRPCRVAAILARKRWRRVAAMNGQDLRKRAVDTSNKDARLAVADVATRLEPLRHQVALITAKAQRPLTPAARDAMMRECTAIRRATELARVDLLERLLEAPRKVAGHSRVTDIEKALDNLDDALAAAMRLLKSTTSNGEANPRPDVR